jgi:hypothetical protein
MLARCLYQKHDKFKYYGGRGITVCDKWKEFSKFFEDMGEPEKGRTLDRIDNNAGYSKENCRWATRHEQHYNKRNTRYCTANGETLTVYDWATRLGIRPGVIYCRLTRGWNEERAVSTPLHGANVSNGLEAKK